MKSKFSLSLLTLASLVFSTQSANAQTYTPSNRIPVADSTQIGTQVSGNGSTFNIIGGVNKGQTLFHSFTDFSVPTSGTANFVNITNPRDIITRVTGNVFSDINGTVNTNGANFFLINPNGIVFGTNAKLNVGRAFVGSTANSIDLVDAGGQPIKFGTNPNGDAPLLSVAPNVLFDVSRLNMGGGTGAISNFGTLQTNNPSQYIGLIGGNVTLDGSQGGGKIIAPGGRVDIGGLNSAGTVTANDQGLVFTGNNLLWGDVSLISGGAVTVRADRALSNVNTLFGNASSQGSSINISANNINLINNLSTANTVQSNLEAGLGENVINTSLTGDININAIGKVTLDYGGIYQTLLTRGQGKIGNIKIDANSLDLKNQSTISSITIGQGNAGNIDISTIGNLTLNNSSTIRSDNSGIGNAGNIDIKSIGNIEIVGTDAPITLSPTDINQPPLSFISGSTYGKGNTGKITIDATGDITLSDRGGIFSSIIPNTTPIVNSQGSEIKAEGNSQGIEIKNVRDLTLNNSNIQSDNYGGVGNAGNIDIKSTRNLNLINISSIGSNNQGIGNAGNINIKSTGNIEVFGIVDSQSPLLLNANGSLSNIASNTSGKGDTGKITIDTTGDIFLSNGGQILSGIVGATANGNSNGIEIKNARNLTLNYNSSIQSSNAGGTGKAGNIDIKTVGNINILGADSENPLFQNNPNLFASGISSSSAGKGIGGKITIDTTGDINLSNRGGIVSVIAAVTLQGVQFKGEGNSQGIEIKNARNLTLNNRSYISSNTFGTGNAGNIDIKTTGDIDIAASASISSSTIGKGDAGKITLDTPGDITLNNGSTISSEISGASQIQGFELKGEGNSQGIEIKNARNLTLNNLSIIRSDNAGGTGNAGDIGIKVNGNINIIGADNTQSSLFQNSGDQYLSGIFSNSSGEGKAANISVSGQKLKLINKSVISTAGNSVSGGDITLVISDQLLLRNDGRIATSSVSSQQDSNGGNITISSPLIVAAPGNNDITANAVQGKGGNVKIFSDGLFGIQKREKRQESPLTNDITASSDFNQQGTIDIDTPGTDPGRDSTELPNTTTDASNQISQVCSASNRQNKLTVTGRGGLPPNANDPLTSDVIWQDARATSGQPVASSATTNPIKLAPPAVGWVFDGKGKVTLIAAGTQGQAGTSVACPQGVGK